MADEAVRKEFEEENSFAAYYDFYKWLYGLPVIYERDEALKDSPLSKAESPQASLSKAALKE